MFSYHMNYILSSSIDHKIALILNWSMNWIQLCLRINQKQTAIICRIPSSSTFHELQDKRQLYCRLDWRTTVKIYVHFKKWQNASKFQGFNAKKTKFIVNLVFESIVGLVVPWCKAIQPTSRPTLQLTDSGSPSRRKCPAKAWAATFSLVPNSFFCTSSKPKYIQQPTSMKHRFERTMMSFLNWNRSKILRKSTLKTRQNPTIKI